MSGIIILVGCGNMGYAMLDGWIASGRLVPGDLIVVEPNETLRQRAAALGVNAHAGAAELDAATAPALVIFAVKPQAMRDVVPAYRRFAPAATFLSIAAGTGIATISEMLGADAAIVRCMPNTPAAIGKGMMVTFANPHVTAAASELVAELLAASGAVAAIDEEALMDAVTAVSGSGPAYVFHFIECLTQAGEKVGLPPDVAKLLAMQTVYGAANLARESGVEPGELRRQVTSPNGTTAAALGVLMGADRMKAMVEEAVEAARRRGEELGR